MSMCDLGKANNRTSMEAEANQRGKQKQTFRLLTKRPYKHNNTTQHEGDDADAELALWVKSDQVALGLMIGIATSAGRFTDSRACPPRTFRSAWCISS